MSRWVMFAQYASSLSLSSAHQLCLRVLTKSFSCSCWNKHEKLLNVHGLEAHVHTITVRRALCSKVKQPGQYCHESGFENSVTASNKTSSFSSPTKISSGSFRFELYSSSSLYSIATFYGCDSMEMAGRRSLGMELLT